MSTLTIRDLDEALKLRLRIRAASRNRSMEEEVRQILRAALQSEPEPAQDLAARIRARFAPLGGIELPLPAREPMREPPSFESATKRTAASAKRAKRSP